MLASMTTLSRPALLIAAHGSKVQGWAHAVEAFAADVSASPGVSAGFSVVQAAYLEHCLPLIPEAVRTLLSSGCREVVVVPLFLSVARHAAEDVPGLLGLPVADHIRRRLLAEGKRPLAQGLPLRLVPLGDVQDLIFRNVVRRVSLQSTGPAHEAVVLCAYGSTIHHGQWEALMHALRTRLMRHGFGYAAHAYVGHIVGLSPQPTADAIQESAKMAGIRRVHVVPLLMSKSHLQTQTIAAAVRDSERRVRAKLLYSGDAILPDGDLAAHVGFTALRALGVFPSMGGEVEA